MATRKEFARNLESRIRKLGWPIRVGSAGVLNVTCPDGFNVQLHHTPSDVNQENVVMRLLNQHGFAEAEAEYGRLNEEERQRRNKEIQEENQRKLDLAQKQADSLSFAAGRSRVSEETILSPYPVPKTFERVL